MQLIRDKRFYFRRTEGYDVVTFCIRQEMVVQKYPRRFAQELYIKALSEMKTTVNGLERVKLEQFSRKIAVS